MEAPKAQVVVRDFVGLLSNSSAHDTPVGAGIEQLNIQSLQIGELCVRGGLREAVFDPT